MFARALSLYRRHFGALILMGALAIAPASLLAGGSLHAVVPRLSNQSEGPPEKGPRPEGLAAGMQRFGFPHIEPAHPIDALTAVLPVLYATFSGVLLLAFGACLALAAFSAAVFDEKFSVAHAWGRALSRLGPLFATILLSGLLIAIGCVLFFLPGAALAVGLAFAIPAVMHERLSGRAALHRSWHLARDHWPAMLGFLLLLALLSAAASALAQLTPDGPLQAVVATVFRCLTWPLPLAGLAVAYEATRPKAAAASSTGARSLP
ncbi:MAG TPA: hypothetical protein VGH20_16070 [Myxococcales bacterium]|jgi:hypothetical protein